MKPGALGSLLLVAGSAALAACGAVTLPAPESPAPQPRHPELRAGIARVDITPPPGGGMLGYGPEGKKAIGYRQRLWARVLVLEDADGERIAIVATELMAPSTVLHREVAQRTRASSGIGADRLVIAATHTHAAPGHYFGNAFETLGTDASAGGFDRRWTDELVARVADAVDRAAAGLAPARLRWSSFPVRGVTFNRNLVPYRSNRTPWLSPFDRGRTLDLPDAHEAVDPQWLMLRVDTAGGTPIAALSVFAVHGTGNPSANLLYDADLHGWFSQAFERSVDQALGRERKPVPEMLHLFVNGSAGDVSAMPPRTRCPVPTLNPRVAPWQYEYLIEDEAWRAPSPDALHACMERSREHMARVIERLLPEVLPRFQAAAPMRTTRVRRAFATIRPGPAHGLCPWPQEGVASAAGAPDGRTRYAMSFVPHVQEGAPALADSADADECQYPKRAMLHAELQDLLGKLEYLPLEAQFSVLRVGELGLGTVPFEVTTTAGGRMKDALAAELGIPDTMVAVLSITNGYLHYVASYDEYQRQHYEGAATIWGPRSDSSFGAVLTDLASRLDPAAPSPASPVGEARAWSRKPLLSLMSLPRPERLRRVDRVIGSPGCNADTLAFGWTDVGPGRLLRATYPLLALEQEQADGSWRAFAWDDDPHLEVRHERSLGGAHAWSARWSGSPPRATGMLRAVLLERPDHPRVEGSPIPPCPAPPGAGGS